VVGAGGVGSMFGGRLAAAGHEVWLVHRRREVVDALQRDGLLLETPTGDEHIPVHATSETAEVGVVDLVLVLTKSQDTPAAAQAARPLVGESTCVVTLQNGLGNLETLADALGEQHVLMGMMYVGATLLGPGRARHTAAGKSFVGEPSGAASERARELAAVFSAAGLPTEATERLWDEVWGKLLINAALNASCALTGAAGTDVLASEAARTWIGLVADETARVASAHGVRLPYPDPGARVLRHCEDIQTAKPSMLQDVERGRPTEIEAINGAIVKLAHRLNLATPYNEALLLLVRMRQDVLFGTPQRTVPKKTSNLES
jgi:2-dehydropantoate 2-reductase